MQVVINIPEKDYQKYCEMRPAYPKGVFCYIKAIQNGIILPEGHGRLIDADSLDLERLYRENDDGSFSLVYTESEHKTIIEADTESEVIE